MAQTKKSVKQPEKKTANRKSSKKRTNKKLHREVQAWLIAGVLLIITLGIYLQSGMGLFGETLHTVFVGLLGIAAYLMSLYSLGIAVFGLFGKVKGRNIWFKLGTGYVMMLLFAILFHVINGRGFLEASTMYEQGSAATGGVIGGVLGRLLLSLLGTAGAIILIVILLLVCLIIVTEQSIVKWMGLAAGKTKNGAKQVKDYSAKRVKEVSERRRERQVEKARKIADLKAETLASLEKSDKAYTEKEKRQIVIRDLQDDETDAEAAVQEETVEEALLDIPLLAHDTYLEKKRRQLRRQQAEQGAEDKSEGAEMASKTETPVSKKEKPRIEIADIPTWDPLPEEETYIPSKDADASTEEIIEGPIIQEEDADDLEAFSKGVSLEKAFAKEEFPSGYEDHAGKANGQGRPHEAVKVPGPTGHYEFPSVELLTPGSKETTSGNSREELLRSAKVLEDALMSFGVEAKVIQVNRGPAVTRFELQPKQGVKVSRIVNLTDDIAMNLAAPSIRIEAPIPGKSAVGIEVPNAEISTVMLREVIDSDTFRRASSKVTFALGRDIDGEVRVADIAKMPHLLIAGATGSGKSVCINSLIVSLIYKAHPNDVKLILIDPKVVELSVYNGIPHLLLPVVNEPKKAAATLNWAVQEMTRRYKRFADLNVRDIRGFNEAVEELGEEGEEKMPQIVIIIDELADLMMVASKEVEAAICRIAQMARAAGMHLVIATQRPSVDVITGLIKANIPSRLAFAVSSGIDSRTILDTVGAEHLLGKGDMLFFPIGASKAVRIQGTFVSDKEVEAVVEAVRLQGVKYDTALMESLQGESSVGAGGVEDEIDEYLEEAIRFVVDKQKASISMLQRAFRIGFNRAARLIDALELRGVVGPDEGSKPRKVLMTKEEWENDQY